MQCNNFSLSIVEPCQTDCIKAGATQMEKTQIRRSKALVQQIHTKEFCGANIQKYVL